MNIELYLSRDMGAGVYFEWYAEGYIVAFRNRAQTNADSRHVIDTWIANAVHVIKKWDKTTPFLCLVDMQNFPLTLHAANRAQAMQGAISKDLAGRMAIANAGPRLQGMMQSAMGSRAGALPNLTVQLYAQFNAALEWLAEGLPDA